MCVELALGQGSQHIAPAPPEADPAAACFSERRRAPSSRTPAGQHFDRREHWYGGSGIKGKLTQVCRSASGRARQRDLPRGMRPSETRFQEGVSPVHGPACSRGEHGPHENSDSTSQLQTVSRWDWDGPGGGYISPPPQHMLAARWCVMQDLQLQGLPHRCRGALGSTRGAHGFGSRATSGAHSQSAGTEAAPGRAHTQEAAKRLSSATRRSVRDTMAAADRLVREEMPVRCVCAERMRPRVEMDRGRIAPPRARRVPRQPLGRGEGIGQGTRTRSIVSVRASAFAFCKVVRLQDPDQNLNGRRMTNNA